jgi:predicted deacetylase
MFLKRLQGKILFGFVVLLFVAVLSVSRSPLIVDDVHDSYECPSLLAKADVLYVTPILHGHSIADKVEWCSYILSLNATLGLHGIVHSYHEFDENVTQQELDLALDAFSSCFNQTPTLFRPPYNVISNGNRALIEQNGMNVYDSPYHVHPYCHCEPQGYMKLLNWLILC